MMSLIKKDIKSNIYLKNHLNDKLGNFGPLPPFPTYIIGKTHQLTEIDKMRDQMLQQNSPIME